MRIGISELIIIIFAIVILIKPEKLGTLVKTIMKATKTIKEENEKINDEIISPIKEATDPINSAVKDTMDTINKTKRDLVEPFDPRGNKRSQEKTNEKK